MRDLAQIVQANTEAARRELEEFADRIKLPLSLRRGPRFNLAAPKMETHYLAKRCERCGRSTLVPPERCRRHRRGHVVCYHCREQQDTRERLILQAVQEHLQTAALMSAPAVGSGDN